MLQLHFAEFCRTPAVGDFVPGFEASAWFGVGAPKNTPSHVVQVGVGSTSRPLSNVRDQKHIDFPRCMKRNFECPLNAMMTRARRVPRPKKGREDRGRSYPLQNFVIPPDVFGQTLRLPV